MNTAQIDLVQRYLEMETNYAIVIQGKYGIGKTHFFKNVLANEIKKVPVKDNNEKHFIPIHISLFGLKSVEDIQTSIFLELYPFLKGKKLAVGIGKAIIRGIVKVIGAGNIDDYLKDLETGQNDLVFFDEIVICFDDLDRKSSALESQDVFGFINSLVENQGAKVLIIANENELNKPESGFDKLKEKVLGQYLQYIPSTESVFQNIVDLKYKDNWRVYYAFLNNHKQEIIDSVIVNENNFRSLIFFLEQFKCIFDILENHFQENKKAAVGKDEKLLAILNFSLAVACEIKSNSLNASNYNEISPSYLNNIRSEAIKSLIPSLSKHEENSEPTVYERFLQKYYPASKKYCFFSSILEYFLGISSFSITAVVDELDKHFPQYVGTPPEQMQILNKLAYFDCLNLSPLEYRRLTAKMLQFSDRGKYELYQYLTVFHNAVRFNNLLNYDIIHLKTRLMNGARRCCKSHKYTPNIQFYMILHSEIEFKTDTNEIVQFCIRENELLKKNEQRAIQDDHFKRFLTDFEKFEEYSRGDILEVRFEAFWCNYKAKEIYKRVLTLSNEQIWRLGFYFQNRHQSGMSDKLYQEKKFVEELISLVDNGSKVRMKKTLKNASLDFLVKCLKESVTNFPQLVS